MADKWEVLRLKPSAKDMMSRYFKILGGMSGVENEAWEDFGTACNLEQIRRADGNWNKREEKHTSYTLALFKNLFSFKPLYLPFMYSYICFHSGVPKGSSTASTRRRSSVPTPLPTSRPSAKEEVYQDYCTSTLYDASRRCLWHLGRECQCPL